MTWEMRLAPWVLGVALVGSAAAQNSTAGSGAAGVPETTPSAQPSAPGAAQSAPGAAQRAPGAAQSAPGAAQAAPEDTGAPKGQVLFQSHGEPPAAQGELPPAAVAGERAVPAGEVPEVTDRERAAVTVLAYDLDLRLTPASAGMSLRARLTLRNDSGEPLTKLPLQVSSALHWDSVTLPPGVGGAGAAVPFAQHLLDTDADTTGKANEVILTLARPLAPGAAIAVDAFVSGKLPPSGARLTRLGATAAQAAAADWDGITPDGTALRGFGNVLWYPVASRQLFLGDGAALFRAVGAMRLRERNATVRLRVAVAYRGDPPTAVYFCARRQELKAVSDDENAPTATGTGLATAEFRAAPLGFRSPDLFVLERPELLAAPLPGDASLATVPPRAAGSASAAAAREAVDTLAGVSSSAAPAVGPEAAAEPGAAAQGGEGSGTPMLAVETNDDAVVPSLATAAEAVAPLLGEWMGVRPVSALTIVDHPGQPFEDGPLLVAPAAALATSGARPAMVQSLAHAWVQTGQPWIDEGLSQFMALLWTEREEGRAAALAQLAELMRPVDLAEPAFASAAAADAATAAAFAAATAADADAAVSGAVRSEGAARPEGAKVSSSSAEETAAPQIVATAPMAKNGGPEPLQPLIAASDEVFYRRKAAAVWWMLRDQVGDEALRAAVSAWRTQPVSEASPREQALGLEHLLEKTSGKDLGAFFTDWVLEDRGLPDLIVADVTPRQLPAGPGHAAGWLVAVTVQNRGAAMADVPLVIRSGEFSTTRRMQIPGFGSTTERVVVESAPTEVRVNDGSVPEVRTSEHVRQVVARAP